MRKVIYVWAAMVVSVWAASAQDVTGDWEGTAPLRGGTERYVVEIRRQAAGILTATVLTSSGTLNDGDSVTLDGPNLKILGTISLEGRLNAAGDSIDGAVRRGGSPVPIVLHRMELGAARKEHRTLQYQFRDIRISIPTADEPRMAKFSPKPALDYLEQGALAWNGERQCISCHTTGTFMLIRPQLSAAFGPPGNELRDSFVATLKTWMPMDAAKLQVNLLPAESVQLAAGLAQWDAKVTRHLSPETEDALANMFRLQLDDGSWKSSTTTPPFESSAYQLATVAARAVGVAPGWLAKQRGAPFEAGINRLIHYLQTETRIQGDYDRAALLWAVTEMPGLLDEARKQELVKMLFGHQERDGGWSLRSMAKPEEWGRGNRAKKIAAEPEFLNHTSDGHMTGMAIIVLRQAGVPASDPRIQRGVEWLLTNQRASGRWWTRSLNSDNLNFINYSGTAYPLLALELCGKLPKQGKKTLAAAGR